MNWNDVLDLALAAGQVRDEEVLGTRFAGHLASCEERDGPGARASLIRDVVRALLLSRHDAIDLLTLPARVRDLVRDDFERQRLQVENAPDDYLHLRNYHVRAVFRVIAFRRILVGNEYIEESGLPRQLLWRGGPRQMWGFPRVLLQLGGYRPLYEFHLARWATRVTEADRRLCCRNAAGCLELNPHVLGAMGGSWFYDPQMERVSPHLTFLREMVTSNGGSLLVWGETQEARSLALAKSQTRRRLFEQGLYTPKHYLVVWPREPMIEWAQRGGGDALPAVRAE